MANDDQVAFRRTHNGWVPGIIVIGLGVLFLLNNLGVLRIYNWWALWPVVVIAIGFQRVIDSSRRNDQIGGVIMIGIGGVFLTNNLGLLPWRVWDFWPVLLIVAGILMIFNRASVGFVAGYRARFDKSPRADAVAIFGGFKRQFTGEDFRGATYTAVFGGGEIDLRRAQMQADAAVIEITAIFGGFEIKVPTNWLVVNEVVGIFGGTGDETLAPNPDAPGVKRLIVKGAAVFGGVGLKN